MKRNTFIKTLVLGTGVLATGVSIAEPKIEPKTHFTLLELMNVEGCKILVERIGGSTSQLSVMLIVFTKEKLIVKSIECLPEVINDQWGTPHIWFNTREELAECMLNVRRHMTQNNIDWNLRCKVDLFTSDVQGHMGDPKLNEVLAFKYIEELKYCNTYVVTQNNPYRLHQSIKPETNIPSRFI